MLIEVESSDKLLPLPLPVQSQPNPQQSKSLAVGLQTVSPIECPSARLEGPVFKGSRDAAIGRVKVS